MSSNSDHNYLFIRKLETWCLGGLLPRRLSRRPLKAQAAGEGNEKISYANECIGLSWCVSRRKLVCKVGVSLCVSLWVGVSLCVNPLIVWSILPPILIPFSLASFLRWARRYTCLRWARKDSWVRIVFWHHTCLKCKRKRFNPWTHVRDCWHQIYVCIAERQREREWC